jgi:hypothetical protein
MLAAWCFSWVAKVTDPAERAEEAFVRLHHTWRSSPLYVPGVDDVILTHAKHRTRDVLRRTTEAIRAGTPAPAPPDTVDYFDAMQLRWAERQVYSAADGFAYAREMLSKDAEFRTPVRWSFG